MVRLLNTYRNLVPGLSQKVAPDHRAGISALAWLTKVKLWALGDRPLPNDRLLRQSVPGVRRLLSVMLAMVCFVTALPAQASTESVKVEFSAFSLKGKISNISFLSDGKAIPIDVGDYRRSETVEYVGNGEIVFFSGKLSKQGKPRGVVARAQIDRSLKHPLLIFANTAEGYQIIQVEDDPSSFPTGSIRFMNLTSLDHSVNIGIGEDAREILSIPPLQFKAYTMIDEDHGNLRLRIAKKHEGEMRMLRDCRIFPELSQRYIYFIYQPDPKKARIQLSSLFGGV